eukprot:6208888-Pleurochrysis_carterae.AAC.3
MRAWLHLSDAAAALAWVGGLVITRQREISKATACFKWTEGQQSLESRAERTKELHGVYSYNDVHSSRQCRNHYRDGQIKLSSKH